MASPRPSRKVTVSVVAGFLGVLLTSASPAGADQFSDSVADVSSQIQTQSAAMKPAIARSQTPAAPGVRTDPALAAVPLAPHSTEMKVGDPWTDENRRRMYDWAGPPGVGGKVAGVIFYESPLPFGPILGPLMDPFKSSDADKIAGRCKSSFKEYWDQIGCISKGVNEFFKGFKFDGQRSFCRSHAQAFDVTFAKLNIQRTWSQHIDATGVSIEKEGHVANFVAVSNETGAFSYVIDSGWFPGTLFPLNDLAVRFHSRHGGGKSDYLELPAIHPDAVTRYQAAPR